MLFSNQTTVLQMQKLFLAICLFVTIAVEAQIPVLQYGHSTGGNSEHGEFARDMVTDPEGNVYLTGIFHDTVDFDPSVGVSELVSTGDDDIFIAKYNPAGALVWVKLVMILEAGMSTAEERPAAITRDETGNLYIIGESSLGMTGTIISKWTPDGNEVWTKFLTENNPLTDIFPADIMALGNTLTIAGSFRGTVDFDPSATAAAQLTGNTSGFLLSLDLDGNFQWVKDIRSNSLALVTNIEGDGQGNIYAVGLFNDAVDFDPSGQDVIIQSNSSSDDSAFIAKYTSQGDFVWGNSLLVNAVDSLIFMSSIAIDSEDNLIMMCPFLGTVTLDQNGTDITSLSSPANTGTLIVKYSATGSLTWAKAIKGTNQALGFAADVAIDACDAIYLSGEFIGGLDFDPSSSNFILFSDTNAKSDVFLTSFTEAGDFSWAIRIGGQGNPDFVELNGHLPLVVDNEQNVVLAATFVGSLDLDPSNAVTNVTSVNLPDGPPTRDFFLAKYSNPSNCTLGVNDFQGQLFKMYPNPASESVHLILDQEYAEYTIQVYDNIGKLILSHNTSGSQPTIDVSMLTTGIYFIEIEIAGKVFVEKLLVE